MNKIKIKLVTVDYLPTEFNEKKLLNWKSKLFEIDSHIDYEEINENSELEDWCFSDYQLENRLKKYNSHPSDFIVFISNIPLENGWYTRRLNKKMCILTFHKIKNILSHENVPLENILIKVLYSYSLAFKVNNYLPNYSGTEQDIYLHEVTRGCLFDKTPIKDDLLASFKNPCICKYCKEKYNKVINNMDTMNSVQSELSKLKKDSYYRIAETVKKHPILSIVLAGVFSIICSVIASSIYEKNLFSICLLTCIVLVTLAYEKFKN